MIEELKKKITLSYEEGVTLDSAERLASEFLAAMIVLSEQLRKMDLNVRMNKSALKTIKSIVRLEEVKRHEKKPSEGQLEDVVNTNSEVTKIQDTLDNFEVDKEQLKSTYEIFKEAHIHYRGISKGKYE